jgi:hypothetical protein
MKNQTEDKAFEQWRQAKIDRDWDNLPQIITCRQKIGTVIPFSRTVDRDPNPRIPLSVPENSYPRISKKEALFWFVVGAVLMGVWLS